MQSILVIDDQPDLRSTLQLVLAGAGYDVSTAANGREAGSLLAQRSFDLVITDVIMPQRDGLEVMMDLRKTKPGLPVIVMTGGGHLQAGYYLKLARDLGAKGILQKPFTNEQLLMTVALALPPPPAPAGG